MVMGYDSTLEWVIGRNLPKKPKLTSKSKQKSNTAEKRTTGSTGRRVVVHAEASDDGFYSETSIEGSGFNMKKKVRFNEASIQKEADAKTPEIREDNKVADCLNCPSCSKEREEAELKAIEVARAEKQAVDSKEKEAQALKEKEAQAWKELERQSLNDCKCKTCEEHRREQRDLEENEKPKPPDCNCRACQEHRREARDLKEKQILTTECKCKACREHRRETQAVKDREKEKLKSTADTCDTCDEHDRVQSLKKNIEEASTQPQCSRCKDREGENPPAKNSVGNEGDSFKQHKSQKGNKVQGKAQDKSNQDKQQKGQQNRNQQSKPQQVELPRNQALTKTNNTSTQQREPQIIIINRTPYINANMVKRIIQGSRGEVVLREDVIECPSDPKPNAFFDSKTSVLRVYHGPVYGNPFATLIPLSTSVMPIGSFQSGDGAFGFIPMTPNQQPILSQWQDPAKQISPSSAQQNNQQSPRISVNNQQAAPAPNDPWASFKTGTAAIPGAWVNDNHQTQNNNFGGEWNGLSAENVKTNDSGGNDWENPGNLTNQPGWDGGGNASEHDGGSGDHNEDADDHNSQAENNNGHAADSWDQPGQNGNMNQGQPSENNRWGSSNKQNAPGWGQSQAQSNQQRSSSWHHNNSNGNPQNRNSNRNENNRPNRNSGTWNNGSGSNGPGNNGKSWGFQAGGSSWENGGPNNNQPTSPQPSHSGSNNGGNSGQTWNNNPGGKQGRSGSCNGRSNNGGNSRQNWNNNQVEQKDWSGSCSGKSNGGGNSGKNWDNNQGSQRVRPGSNGGGQKRDEWGGNTAAGTDSWDTCGNGPTSSKINGW